MAQNTAWRGFRSVLCAVDFSDTSRLALRYAAALAARRGSGLTVAYANDPLLVAAAAVALNDRTVAAQSGRELKRFIDATVAGERRRVGVKTRISVGPADEKILESVAAARADVLVMGTHGLTGADRWFMGSTALSVLQRTKVPVLAVPSGLGEAAPTLSSWPDDRIVAAVELDRRSRHDVETAAQIAEWFGASLLLLHVIDDREVPSWLKGTVRGDDRIRLAQAQRRLEALAIVSRRRIATETHVACGRPADEIAAFAVAERTGLLITALRDRRGWFGARRGSVSYQVLSHAVVPVLAWPPKWRPR